MRWLCLLLVAFAGPAPADGVHVAVAANFAAPASALAPLFERASGHRLLISTGSTGKLYAQVKNGAPYDVFLSADAETAARMEREGLAVAGQAFTYALGTLVLWSPRPGLVDAQGAVLRSGGFRRLAIANPRLAPYGAAAREAMQKLGVWEALGGRVVQGENIAQAYQFVSSGNAELGFVALSQVREPGKTPAGSSWVVPQSLYAPIRQDAALLVRAADSAPARRFLDFLRSALARALIRDHGYELP